MNTDHLTDMIERLGPLEEDWVHDYFYDSWGDALCHLLVEDWGYNIVGSGHFGVAIDGPDVGLPEGTVVKLCASENDSYPVWVEYCATNPHPSLPRVHGYGWTDAGIFWCILPLYEQVDTNEFAEAWYGPSPDAIARRQYWDDLLSDFEDIADLDIHEGNIMRDPDGGYILTDPLGYLTPGTYLDDARHTLSNRGLL